MTRLATAASLAGILVLVFATVTSGLKADGTNDGVREGTAVVTALSANASAITYWVSAPDGWHVVTTVDTVFGRESDAEIHAIVRFSAVLLPDQSQLISVPLPIGEQQQVLRIRRLGDRVEIVRVPDDA